MVLSEGDEVMTPRVLRRPKLSLAYGIQQPETEVEDMSEL